MNPFDFFEQIFCINLDSRPDRWEDFLKEAKKIGIQDRVTRFSGVVPPSGDGAVGCKVSTLKIIELAKEKNLKNFLIFEDDVVFSKDTVKNMVFSIHQLPEDWDMFYLGINLKKQSFKYSPNLVKVEGGRTTHAVAYRNSIYQKILQENSLDVNQKIDLEIDKYYELKVHPCKNVYCSYPLVASQREGYSDIQNRKINYSFINNAFSTFVVRGKKILKWGHFLYLLSFLLLFQLGELSKPIFPIFSLDGILNFIFYLANFFTLSVLATKGKLDRLSSSKLQIIAFGISLVKMSQWISLAEVGVPHVLWTISLGLIGFSHNPQFLPTLSQERLANHKDGDVDVKELQKRLLQMMISFDELCKKNQISYWLDGGTLLGAIRHKGFIPWDDDIDICMTVEDFEKFKKVNQEKQLPKNIILEKYGDRFATKSIKKNRCCAKVRDVRSIAIENKNFISSKHPQGAWIDVFINYSFRDEKITNSLKFLDELQHLEKRSILYNILIRPFLKLLKVRNLSKIFLLSMNVPLQDSRIIKHPHEIANKKWWNKEDIFPLKRCSFEDCIFPIPNNYDKYLKDFYGDYMKVPAKKYQNPSHIQFFSAWE